MTDSEFVMCLAILFLLVGIILEHHSTESGNYYNLVCTFISFVLFILSHYLKE